MTRLITLLLCITFLSANAQKCYTNGNCNFFTTNCKNRTIEWNGKCKDNFINGYGTLKVFEDKKLLYTYLGETFNGQLQGLAQKYNIEYLNFKRDLF